MSESSQNENDNNNEMHQGSNPSSPNLLSSPAERPLHSSSEDSQSHASNSSVFDVSDQNSQSCSQASPPSSPLKRGKKRPSYSAYKDDPTIPIPRQTVDRWEKKARAESYLNESSGSSDQSSMSFDDNHDREIGSKPSAVASQASHFSKAPDDDSHQPESPEGSLSLSCNLSQSSDESFSGSGEESDLGTGNNDSFVQSDNLSDSTCSFQNISDFDCDNDGDGNSSDSSFNGSDPFESDSLYPGCGKTKDEAIHELITVYLCKKLSKSALSDILRFYVTSLPPDHVMPSSVHLLFKYVRDLSFPLTETEHYYCRPSMHSVASQCGPCTDCGSVDIGVFYELPLENIIRFLFEQRGLADVIDSYSETRRQRSDNICDITDGSEYRRVWGDISSRYKVTLLLNTDGVSPHSSSKARFWPLMFTIMEVPPHIRPSFTIVWGIWFDKKFKPNMNLYLKPFISSLVKLHQGGGVSWKKQSTGTNQVSPVRAPLMVADAPARAAVLNMQEHQAKYACNTCEQKTSKLAAPPTAPGEKKIRRKRRFIFKEEAATLRTHARMLVCGSIGTELVPKRGIKGLTVMRDIPFLDLSTCVVAEYMHSVLCGVVKQICSMWLFEKGPWYIGNHLDAINKFLVQDIHPPDFVSRLPRSFEYFTLLKANEFRSFLLYFSLVVVAPYLKQEYHQHWMLFVQSIFILLTESISERDLSLAEVFLRLFVRDLGNLYGGEQYVYNCHQILHLCLYVRRWGCLWATSAFSFEGLNGVLSDMIHGSKNEGRELINQLSLAQGNQMLKNKIITDVNRKIGVSVLGKPLLHNFSDVELNYLRELNVNMESLECYGRIQVRREMFSSQAYDKTFKRRNSYVELKYRGRKTYGRIAVFCKSVDSIFCIVSVYNIDHTKFFFHRATMTKVMHLIPAKDSGDLIVCEASDIVQKLIQVGDYLCFRPNSIERNL